MFISPERISPIDSTKMAVATALIKGNENDPPMELRLEGKPWGDNEDFCKKNGLEICKSGSWEGSDKFRALLINTEEISSKRMCEVLIVGDDRGQEEKCVKTLKTNGEGAVWDPKGKRVAVLVGSEWLSFEEADFRKAMEESPKGGFERFTDNLGQWWDENYYWFIGVPFLFGAGWALKKECEMLMQEPKVPRGSIKYVGVGMAVDGFASDYSCRLACGNVVASENGVVNRPTGLVIDVSVLGGNIGNAEDLIYGIRNGSISERRLRDLGVFPDFGSILDIWWAIKKAAEVLVITSAENVGNAGLRNQFVEIGKKMYCGKKVA